VYVIRIMDPQQFHFFTGKFAYGQSLWSRDPAKAATFKTVTAAHTIARTLPRWVDNAQRIIAPATKETS